MTRKFLVTKFVCAKCGCNLSLSYDAPPSTSSYENRDDPKSLYDRCIDWLNSGTI